MAQAVVQELTLSLSLHYMDTKTFKDTKADYMKLYAELGLPYRGESKDQMKFMIMKYGESVQEEDIKDLTTVAAPRTGPAPKKTTKVTQVAKNDPNADAFVAKVSYEDPEIVPIPTPSKSKAKAQAPAQAPAQEAPAKEETVPKTAEGTRLSWNDYISLKATENPGMSRKDLMVKYSGKHWTDYKALFEA